MKEPKLSHVDEHGEVRMVDVGAKTPTRRRAVAEAHISMRSETLAMIVEGRAPKGDVLATARIAGIMAAKRTSELIPMCHPLALTHATVGLEPTAEGIHVTAICETLGQTGVEMEALTAASVAALTLYDMVKAVDRGMTISDVRLLEKTGGRSGHWTREEEL